MTVNYNINADLEIASVQGFEIDIYRSDKPAYDANDTNNVQVASYQVTGDGLDESDNSQMITIDSATCVGVGQWGINSGILTGPLAPDPQLPYLIATVARVCPFHCP